MADLTPSSRDCSPRGKRAYWLPPSDFSMISSPTIATISSMLCAVAVVPASSIPASKRKTLFIAIDFKFIVLQRLYKNFLLHFRKQIQSALIQDQLPD